MDNYEQVHEFIEDEIYANITDLIELLDEEALDERYTRHGEYPEDYEPMEYWLVSSYLGKRLAKHNEIVWERIGGWIWARQTSGQSIAIDGVMEEIYLEAREIAEGIRLS